MKNNDIKWMKPNCWILCLVWLCVREIKQCLMNKSYKPILQNNFNTFSLPRKSSAFQTLPFVFVWIGVWPPEVYRPYRFLLDYFAG